MIVFGNKENSPLYVEQYMHYDNKDIILYDMSSTAGGDNILFLINRLLSIGEINTFESINLYDNEYKFNCIKTYIDTIGEDLAYRLYLLMYPLYSSNNDTLIYIIYDDMYTISTDILKGYILLLFGYSSNMINTVEDACYLNTSDFSVRGIQVFDSLNSRFSNTLNETINIEED